MTTMSIDVHHDYMSLIYEHVIKVEAKKDIQDVIRGKFIEFKETDEYKNKEVESDEWVRKYVMDKNDIKELYNSFGHLNILKLLPKFANAFCFASYDDFLEDCGYCDDIVEDCLMGYIIEEYIIADLR